MNDFENEHYKEKRNKWILITLNIALCAYLVIYYLTYFTLILPSYTEQYVCKDYEPTHVTISETIFIVDIIIPLFLFSFIIFLLIHLGMKD